MVQMLGLMILEELRYLKTQLFVEICLVMALLLLEPHAVEVHILLSWSYENVANGSLVSVTLWSKRVIFKAVSMVYSSCEFQRQDSFRGVPELLLGHPYNLSYLAGPCLDCLSLSFSCAAWMEFMCWYQILLKRQPELLLFTCHELFRNNSCSWLSLHTSVTQALFGRNYGICTLQCEKEYPVLLVMAQPGPEFLVFVFSLTLVLKTAYFLILDK